MQKYKVYLKFSTIYETSVRILKITEYLTRSDYTELVLNLKEMKEALTVNTTESTTETTTETTTEATTESLPKRTPKGTPKRTPKRTPKTRDVIVELMRKNPVITIAEIADIVRINERNVKKHTRNLQDDGIIRRVDGNNGGHWEILK